MSICFHFKMRAILIFRIYWTTKNPVFQQNKSPYQKCIYFNQKSSCTFLSKYHRKLHAKFYYDTQSLSN